MPTLVSSEFVLYNVTINSLTCLHQQPHIHKWGRAINNNGKSSLLQLYNTSGVKSIRLQTVSGWVNWKRASLCCSISGTGPCCPVLWCRGHASYFQTPGMKGMFGPGRLPVKCFCDTSGVTRVININGQAMFKRNGCSGSWALQRHSRKYTLMRKITII